MGVMRNLKRRCAFCWTTSMDNIMSRKIRCEHCHLRQDGAICQTRKEHTDEHDRRTFWRR